MRSLFRIIIPVFPRVNIFSHEAKKTTALGPIMVATAANKTWGWDVEVIDENNYRGGPRDKNGLPDHIALQKECPATVVGFYCGLTSTMPRVWEIAEFYHQQKVFTIAGSWHAINCPEETLRHNIDVVVHRDAEKVIRQILSNLGKERFLENISGNSFLENGVFNTDTSKVVEISGLDSSLSNLPFPDFGLLRYAKIKIYPIGRIRGCDRNCEFCIVSGKPHWASAEHLFNTVKWLVETRRAKHFFIVDDRLEGDSEGTKRFFKMIVNKYANRLRFTVQVRLELAENVNLMEVMRNAGVRVVCVGVESPIDEDLKAMRKGYNSDNMLDWIKVLRRYFWVHSMFIVGYPSKIPGIKINAREITKRFRRFIRKSRSDSIQVMLPGPGMGTGLRKRLENESRLFPLDVVGWDKYDGSYVCFQPDNMSVRELQEIPLKIMGRFYNLWNLVKIPLRGVILPVYFYYSWKGWSHLFQGWCRDIKRSGGYFLVKRRREKEETEQFIAKIEKYQKRWK